MQKIFYYADSVIVEIKIFNRLQKFFRIDLVKNIWKIWGWAITVFLLLYSNFL